LEEKVMRESKKGTKVLLVDYSFKAIKPVKERKMGIVKVRAYVV
jgi:hypothetical protein